MKEAMLGRWRAMRHADLEITARVQGGLLPVLDIELKRSWNALRQRALQHPASQPERMTAG